MNLEIQLNYSFVCYCIRKKEMSQVWSDMRVTKNERIFFFFQWTMPLTKNCWERKKEENNKTNGVPHLYESDSCNWTLFLCIKSCRLIVIGPPFLPALHTLFILAALYCSGVIIPGLCGVDKGRWGSLQFVTGSRHHVHHPTL